MGQQQLTFTGCLPRSHLIWTLCASGNRWESQGIFKIKAYLINDNMYKFVINWLTGHWINVDQCIVRPLIISQGHTERSDAISLINAKTSGSQTLALRGTFDRLVCEAKTAAQSVARPKSLPEWSVNKESLLSFWIMCCFAQKCYWSPLLSVVYNRLHLHHPWG